MTDISDREREALARIVEPTIWDYEDTCRAVSEHIGSGMIQDSLATADRLLAAGVIDREKLAGLTAATSAGASDPAQEHQ